MVLEATFGSRTFRGRADLIACDLVVEPTFVRVTCDPAVVRRRIERRTETVGAAGYAEHLEVNSSVDGFERTHVAVDTSGTIEDTLGQVDRTVLRPLREYLDPAGP